MKIIADEWMSLDGVVQSPSGPDEDPSGGFPHGGWHMPYFDAAAHNFVIEGVAAADAYLLGRGTYEIFAAHWPKAGADEQMLAGPLNSKPKYVASTTLSAPLDWANSSLLSGDVPAAVAELARRGDGELHLIGSPKLVQTLMAAGLVDELRLMIDPVLLGTGKRLFPDDGGLRAWRLDSSVPTSTGALLVRYARA
ncbi:MAG TPA: dihydrofolate reductase family protein [Actinoplanes sp.]|nr:dihydrofolate reductase family protein [Actinoplanes sp.]